MKKSALKIILSFLLLSLMANSLFIVSYAQENKASGEITNRYNIIFVNDESGSMTRSDENKLRYEAIRRFIALMAQSGNRIGSVSFNEKIIDSQEMNDVEGFDEKSVFLNHISQFSPTGNVGRTNIGLALDTAVELLNSGRNPNLPSIILLLTDGVTEMGTDKELEESLQLKADALEKARKAGYKIYSVALGNGAHEKELEQLSSATGGEYALVKQAEDLEDAEMMFYKIIFNALTEEASEAVIGPDGQISREFNVPGIGVEELNIIIEGDIDDCSLQDPNGLLYSGEALNKITMQGKDFRLIKINDPAGGIWTATAYGKEGVAIRFKPLYNSSFYINSSINPADGDYHVGDTVGFNAVICDKSGPVNDTTRYDGFKGMLHIQSQDGEYDLEMSLDSDGFNYNYKIEDDGTYYAYITVLRGDTAVKSEDIFEFSVNNRSPEAPEDELKAHANIWPFFGGSAVLDLTDAAIDPDGDPLVYSIETSAFNAEDYSFSDNVIKVDNFSISKGSFTIRATDTKGAYCTFDVLITSTNVGMIMVIIIAAGIIIVIAAIILSIRKWVVNPFMGTITVVPRDPNMANTVPSSMNPGRGRIRLESFGLGLMGLPKGAYFQADGSNKRIHLICKKPVYSDAVFAPKKKITINSSAGEIIISANQDLEMGIVVSFSSILDTDY